ncbi:hypothetical protein VNO80_22526 [Phaseolus coccineus]|uniref:Uncharacterized protein n=1 Tax=Phaseolus coccineus TaxID=3886 RepID=A0AAN9M5V2_PHACN
MVKAVKVRNNNVIPTMVFSNLRSFMRILMRLMGFLITSTCQELWMLQAVPVFSIHHYALECLGVPGSCSSFKTWATPEIPSGKPLFRNLPFKKSCEFIYHLNSVGLVHCSSAFLRGA